MKNRTFRAPSYAPEMTPWFPGVCCVKTHSGMFYQICSQPCREALFSSTLVNSFRSCDSWTWPSGSVGRQYSHIHTFSSGCTQAHTTTQYSLKGDLIKPEGRCNYMQPSCALFSIVMATRRLWTESPCASAAAAQGLYFFYPLDA